MKQNKIVIIVICFSILIAFFTAFQRVQIEKDYKVAEITIDYNEIENLAENSNESIEWWLTNFNDMGAASTAIQEETVNTIVKKGESIRAETVIEAIKRYNWEEEYSNDVVEAIKNDEIDKYDGLLTINKKNLYEFIVQGLKDRYTTEFYKTYESDNAFYIVLDGTADDLFYGNISKAYDSLGDGVYEEQKVVDSRLFNIGIGYDSTKIDLAKKVGLDVILRPINYKNNNEYAVDTYIKENERYNITPRLYIPHGKEVLGYPDNNDELVKYINDKNIIPAMIETSNQRGNNEQDGLYELVENSNYEAVRAFTMWDWIRVRYKFYNYDGAEEIENSMYRAITERNIRLIYFKPFLEGDNKYLTDIDEYGKTFDNLADRLSVHNIEIGKLKPIKEYHIGNFRIFLLCIGIALAGAYLFNKLFNVKKIGNIIYILAILASFVPFVMRGIAEKGFSLGAAVIFSGLAVYYLAVKIKEIYDSKEEISTTKNITKSIKILLITSAISLIGALYVVSILSDVKYMLEMDIFRGVKLAQLVPFAIFIIAYIILFLNPRDEKNAGGLVKTSVKILNKDVKVYYVVVLIIIAAVGYIYISRTGHETSVQPSDLEMIFRNFMENTLIARPRLKEFLLAFPAIFAAVFVANKKMPTLTFIFMLIAVMGTSSIINSFCHIRTPIYLSSVRTAISVGFGIIIGCVVVFVLKLLYKLYIKLMEYISE